MSRTFFLSDEDFQLVKKGAQVLTFNANDTIIKIGDPVSCLYIILSGTILSESKSKVRTMYAKDGILCILAFLDYLETELDDFHPRKLPTSMVTLTAQEKSQVYVIEAYYLNILFQHFPSLTGRFYYHLASLTCDELISKGGYC